MPAQRRELEVKLELSKEQSQRLRASMLDGKSGRAASSRKLRSTYFDTADHALRAAGLSLRVRRIGKRWLQTVKSTDPVTGGVANPIEIESRIETEQPDISAIADKAIRKQVKKAVGNSALVPVFETVVQRTCRLIEAGDGARVEVALDQGTIECTAGSVPVTELELELSSGRASSLLDLAATIVDVGPLRLGTSSKAARGYHLVRAEPPAVPLPRKARPAAVASGQTSLEALRACLESGVVQITHNWRVVVESDDVEGPHQLRVGLRRLRTAFRMFRPVVDNDHLRAVQKKLSDLARRVGEVRDLDVLIGELVRPLSARQATDSGFATLLARLEEEVALRRKDLRALLTSRERTLDQLEIALLPRSLEAIADADAMKKLSKPIDKLAPRVFDKSLRKLEGRGRHIEELGIEDRHTMRKELKTLRYAVEFMAPLFPARDVRSFLKQAARLQDVFGYLNDVALAQRLLSMPSIAASQDAELHRAAGMVIGWHEAQAEHAWLSARAGWERLRDCNKFWR